jgi:hypothetical protein
LAAAAKINFFSGAGAAHTISYGIALSYNNRQRVLKTIWQFFILKAIPPAKLGGKVLPEVIKYKNLWFLYFILKGGDFYKPPQ